MFVFVLNTLYTAIHQPLKFIDEMNPKFPSGRRVLEKGESSCRGSDVNQTIDSRFEPSRPHMGVEISARDNGGGPPAHPLVDNRVTLLLDQQADA